MTSVYLYPGLSRTQRTNRLRTRFSRCCSIVNCQAVQTSSAFIETEPNGFCWLVGSGPGPADYLTVKAAKILQRAEVVIYDDLSSEDALVLAPSSAQKIYVGKRGGVPSIKQHEINALLVELCLQGKEVVRLKGGCPSVFSRVSSEMAALSKAGCSYELVPGVSSALAAPLAAGFPLTDAELGQSFVVITGHDALTTNWSNYKHIPTLVILMGGRSLAIIVEGLLQSGWLSSTKVAIIKAATTPAQQIWQGQLDTIINLTEGQDLSPCIIIVGEIVGLSRLQQGR